MAAGFVAVTGIGAGVATVTGIAAVAGSKPARERVRVRKIRWVLILLGLGRIKIGILTDRCKRPAVKISLICL